MQRGRVIGITLWLLIAAIALLTWYTSLDFNQDGVRILFSFITTSGLPVALFLTTRDKLKKRKFLIWSFSLIVGTAIILRIATIITFNTSGYVTQELIYVHKDNHHRRIEFQMEDVGALGYNRRTVEIEPCCFLFSWINDVNEDDIDKSQWNYVGEYKNELGLKGG